jgi:hypothetical protein
LDPRRYPLFSDFPPPISQPADFHTLKTGLAKHSAELIRHLALTPVAIIRVAIAPCLSQRFVPEVWPRNWDLVKKVAVSLADKYDKHL